jgi:hypothetical protein
MRRAGEASRLCTAALLAVALAVQGCFVADVVLHADGSGTIELHYRFLPEHATVDTETPRFSSPYVHVESIRPGDDVVILKATFTDVTKLSSAAGFHDVRIERDRQGTSERLRVVIRNPKWNPRIRDTLPAPHVGLTLPGPILRASHWATITGTTVTWTIPFLEFAHHPRTKLSVRYLPAGG